MNRIIYGPVSSWRLGRSLGMDLVSAKDKTCSFDCIYCQLGETIHLYARNSLVLKGELQTTVAALKQRADDLIERIERLRH